MGVRVAHTLFLGWIGQRKEGNDLQTAAWSSGPAGPSGCLGGAAWPPLFSRKLWKCSIQKCWLSGSSLTPAPPSAQLRNCVSDILYPLVLYLAWKGEWEHQWSSS